MNLNTFADKTSVIGSIAQKDAFSVQEAAERIGVSVIFLRKKIYAGELKAKKFGTRTLILRQDFQRMLEALPEAS